MNAMKYLAATIALLFLVACGNDVPPPEPYQPPPPPAAQPQQEPTTPTRSEPGYSVEYERAYREANTAVRALSADLNADTFAQAGAKVYRALAIGIKHDREGYDLALLRNRTQMNRLRTDWKTFEGQLSNEDKAAYKQHPEYAAAFREYQELGGN
jgi:hypothetical protein